MAEFIGNYELLHHVATGGMAEIWVATHRDPSIERYFAIKRILPHLAREEKFVDMFLDEARIVSKLTHENIVSIDELGEEDGEYFIAMEFVEGCDLAHALDLADIQAIDLPIGACVVIAMKILDALHFAHEFIDDGTPLNIVHRDVSPHNILVGHNGMIKLVDFGVAKAVERHSKTETGFVKGKLSYMAPEQILKDPIDRRTDLFSVGVVLYELLTRKTPFGRELEAVNNILNYDAENPRTIRDEIPEELAAILLKALSKDIDQRYATCKEMRDALERVRRKRYVRDNEKTVAAFLESLIAPTLTETLEHPALRLPSKIIEQRTEPVLSIDGEADTEAAVDELAATQQQDAMPREMLYGDAPKPLMAPTTGEIGISKSGGAGTTSEISTRTKQRGWFAPVLLALLLVAAGVGTYFVYGPPSTMSSEIQVSDGTTPVGATELVDTVAASEPDVAIAEEDIGFYFVADDSDELLEGDEIVAYLDDTDIERWMQLEFKREDQQYLYPFHMARLTDQTVAEIEAQEAEKKVEPPMIIPGDPNVLATLGPADPDAKPKAKVKKKKKKTKKKRIVKRKRSKKRKKKSKKSIAKKTKKKTKPKRDVNVVDKVVPGGF